MSDDTWYIQLDGYSHKWTSYNIMRKWLALHYGKNVKGWGLWTYYNQHLDIYEVGFKFDELEKAIEDYSK